MAAELQDIAVEEQLIERSGVGNPVTAVLLNFRAYDTLLELAVLVLAVLAVQATSAGIVRRRGGSGWRHNRLLTATLAIVVPVSIVVAGDLLWMGADHPGGAFQAGAVLSGAGIMLILADRLNRRFFSDWRYRLAVVAGVAVFVIVGLGVMAVGEQFLQYPAGLAKTLILAIETAAMASVAVVFIILFDAVAGPVGLWNQSDPLIVQRGSAMTAFTLYVLGGVGLFAMGLFSFLTVAHLLRKILALNVMGAGVFMVLIAIAHPERAATQPASCRSDSACARIDRYRGSGQRDRPGSGLDLPVSTPKRVGPRCPRILPATKGPTDECTSSGPLGRLARRLAALACLGRLRGRPANPADPGVDRASGDGGNGHRAHPQPDSSRPLSLRNRRLGPAAGDHVES